MAFRRGSGRKSCASRNGNNGNRSDRDPRARKRAIYPDLSGHHVRVAIRRLGFRLYFFGAASSRFIVLPPKGFAAKDCGPLPRTSKKRTDNFVGYERRSGGTLGRRLA